MVIPFRSLRYNPGPNQIWGLNFRRVVRWKNEWSYLTRIPSFLSSSALFRISLGATLVGLEVPSGGLNLELKPYAISGLRTDRAAKPPVSNKGNGDFGFDAKYGVTKSMTADFTYNTDFAQVEDDQQQVNLTRFALSFPEKRDFFLEGQGTYSFGAGAGVTASTSDTPVLFFSRRIGLNNGKPVPIRAGGRLTGKAGSYTLGLLNIQSDEDATSESVATNFSVVRVKRNLGRRGYVGASTHDAPSTTNGAGVGGDVRDRLPLLGLSQPERHDLSRPAREPRDCRVVTPAIARSSTTTPTGTVPSSTICTSAPTSTPRSDFCGVRISAAATRWCGSARVRTART